MARLDYELKVMTILEYKLPEEEQYTRTRYLYYLYIIYLRTIYTKTLLYTSPLNRCSTPKHKNTLLFSNQKLLQNLTQQPYLLNPRTPSLILTKQLRLVPSVLGLRGCSSSTISYSSLISDLNLYSDVHNPIFCGCTCLISKGVCVFVRKGFKGKGCVYSRVVSTAGLQHRLQARSIDYRLVASKGDKGSSLVSN